MKTTLLSFVLALGVAASSLAAADSAVTAPTPSVAPVYNPTMEIPKETSADLFTVLGYLLANKAPDPVVFSNAFIPSEGELKGDARVSANLEMLKEAQAILDGKKDLVLVFSFPVDSMMYNPKNHTFATGAVFAFSPWKMIQRICVPAAGTESCVKVQFSISRWASFGGIVINPDKVEAFRGLNPESTLQMAVVCRVTEKFPAQSSLHRSQWIGGLGIDVREFVFCRNNTHALPADIATAIKVGKYVRTDEENAIIARFARIGFCSEKGMVIATEAGFGRKPGLNYEYAKNNKPVAGSLASTFFDPWVAFDGKLIAPLTGIPAVHSYKIAEEGFYIDGVIYQPTPNIQLPAGYLSWQ